MKVSYNKLWKLLIDMNLNKTKLREMAQMSPNTMAKLGKNETISMDIILRICEVLKCDVGAKLIPKMGIEYFATILQVLSIVPSPPKHTIKSIFGLDCNDL